MQLGGANRVIANLVNYFSSIGNEVFLINDVQTIDSKNTYQIDSNIKRLFLDRRKKEYKNGIEKQIYRIRQIRQFLKREKPDVAVSFMGPPNYRMILASLGLKTKTIVSVRNDPYKEYGTGIHKALARFLFAFTDGCVFQTEDAMKYFSKSVQKKSKIIFNPVNEKFYNVQRKPEKKKILMVGRLQPQKNVELAIEAFSHVVEDFPDYKLCIYGEGELKADLQKLSEKLHIEKQVEFCGQTDSVEEKLASAALYLLTSNFEGMPNALMEAMSIGVPVISTDCPCGGPRSLIENNQQGILIPCNDVEALSSAILKVLSNDSLRMSMRNEARNRAKQFKPEIILNEWDAYIKNGI